jgi:perosamine synthetase
MIAVSEPSIGAEELDNVLDCLKTGWISSAGKYIEQFESAWAGACGVTHGVAVSNGSTALDVAVRALQLGHGDEVILPTFTIASCLSAVVNVGAVPVLVDSEPRTWGMDVRALVTAVTERTRAIMVVHIYGHPVDMDPVNEIATRYGLKVIEDAAEVHGARYLSGRDGPSPRWRPCGSMSDIATFSFYANKLITTGEGGMVVTSDDALAQRARSLRNLCFGPPRRFLHKELGFNYRMTNIQAAIGVAQVPRLESIVTRKRAIAATYSSRLRGLKSLELPVEESWAHNVYWVYGMVLKETVPFDAAEFARRLAGRGVETRPFFLGMHEQPALHALGHYVGSLGRFPVAERIARRGIYVPAGLTIEDPQIHQVCDAIEEVLASA